MKKLLIILFALFQFATVAAQSESMMEIVLTDKNNKGDRTEGVLPPDAWFNPGSNKLDIANVIDKSTILEVADDAGSVIFRGAVVGDGGINTFSLPRLKEGSYTVKIEGTDTQYEGEIDIF